MRRGSFLSFFCQELKEHEVMDRKAETTKTQRMSLNQLTHDVMLKLQLQDINTNISYQSLMAIVSCFTRSETKKTVVIE